MPKSYLPSREAALVNWSTNFNSKINATPESPLEYGLTAAQGTDYFEKHNAFVSAYQTATEASTRTSVTIAEKNTKKGELIAMARSLVDIAQASPVMTNAKREALQITVRDNDATPVPVPEDAPEMDLISVKGHTIRLRLHGDDSTGRARPSGVQGATLFSHVGDEPPMGIGTWKFEGNTTKTEIPVIIPPTVAPGSKVWFTAFWFNRRSESGPACTPMSTHVGFGGMSKAA